MLRRIKLFKTFIILIAMILLLWMVSDLIKSNRRKLIKKVELEGCLISSSEFMFAQNDSSAFFFYLDNQEIGAVSFLTLSSSLDDFSQNELLCRWGFELEWQGILKENRSYSYSADFKKKIAQIDTGDSLFVRTIFPSKVLVSLKAKTESRNLVDQFLSNMKFQAISDDSSKIQ